MKALIYNNKIVDVCENEFPVAPGLQWVDCPDNCKPHSWTYENGICVEPNTSDELENMKNMKLLQIEMDRDVSATTNVTAHGRTWQADVKSQQLLSQAITLASAGLPLPSEWRDADNSNMTIVSLAELLDIAAEIANQTESAYATSWARKAALIFASTIEAVSAI